MEFCEGNEVLQIKYDLYTCQQGTPSLYSNNFVHLQHIYITQGSVECILPLSVDEVVNMNMLVNGNYLLHDSQYC